MKKELSKTAEHILMILLSIPSEYSINRIAREYKLNYDYVRRGIEHLKQRNIVTIQDKKIRLNLGYI